MITPTLYEVKHPRYQEDGPFLGVSFTLRSLNITESVNLLPLTESETGSYLLESFVICCVSWTNIYLDGEPLACTPENRRLFGNHNKITYLIPYLLKKVEEQQHQEDRERQENLDKFLHLETGEARYEKESKEHGIEVGMLFERMWCCQTPDNVWSQFGDDPPCEVCPRNGFVLNPKNSFAYQRYQQLDFLGRSRGMQEEPLREEAITMNLQRYQCNVPWVYETVVKMESILFSAKMRKREKERKKEEKGSQKHHQRQIQQGSGGGRIQ